MTITTRQANILAFIKQYQDKHDRPPTLREIGDEIDVPSTGTIHYNVGVLIAKGYVTRTPAIARGLRVIA